MTPTRRQLEVLRFLVSFERQHGYGPTQKQIAEALGTSKGSVCEMLGRLVQAGYLRRFGKGKWQGLDVVDRKVAELETVEHAARCARFAAGLLSVMEQIDKQRGNKSCEGSPS